MSTARLMRSGSIRKVRDTLVVGFREAVRARAVASGIPPSQFRDWVDEIVGEGIAVALSCLDQWDEERGDFLTWARLKTSTLMRDELQKERKHYLRRDHRPVETITLPSRRSDIHRRIEIRRQLLDIFDNLTEDQARSLVLYHLLGYSVKEIASVTGKPDTAIYTLLRRGRKRAAQTRQAAS